MTLSSYFSYVVRERGNGGMLFASPARESVVGRAGIRRGCRFEFR